MTFTTKNSSSIVADSSAIIIPPDSATKPTPGGSNKPWSIPPEDGDKYRALVAISHFKATGAQHRFMTRLIDRANPKTGRCDPGTTTLGKDAKAAARSIERARAYWRKKGVISYRQRPNTSATYRINWNLLHRIFAQHFRKPEINLDGPAEPAQWHRKNGQEGWAMKDRI